MNKMQLYFPQWQGSGTTSEIYTGASLLKSELETEVHFVEIPQPTVEDLVTERGVIGYQRILKNLAHSNKLLKTTNPDKVFTLGGDCGIEVGPVTYLNERYHSDLLVIWFDAHGDLNTPESSPSQTFHGMPLRMILGEGEPDLMKHTFSTLNPNQVILAGTRDLDVPEQEYIQKNTIDVIEPKSLSLEKLGQLIEQKGQKNIYIHFDLDVIDPGEFPEVKCPTNNGLSIDLAQQIVSYLKEHWNVVGGSIVEYTPKSDIVHPEILKLTKLILL